MARTHHPLAMRFILCTPVARAPEIWLGDETTSGRGKLQPDLAEILPDFRASERTKSYFPRHSDRSRVSGGAKNLTLQLRHVIPVTVSALTCASINRTQLRAREGALCTDSHWSFPQSYFSPHLSSRNRPQRLRKLTPTPPSPSTPPNKPIR